MDRSPLPRIPAMNDLLAAGEERGLGDSGREALRRALAAALDELRRDCRRGRPRELDDSFWSRVGELLAVAPAVGVRPVINATGVVLHTNLGRAPWAPEAVRAAAAAAGGYAVVEIDLAGGGRGERAPGVAAQLRRLTGAEDALAVNNNAAAVLLALSALARGRKVAVARSELVEIGGSYRMPEVVAAAGARTVECGTTNRVHLRDFAAALEDPEVACVLKVHPSNFRLEGFTAAVEPAELAELCRAHAVPLVFDLGSGVLGGDDLPGTAGEPNVRAALAAGCDLVTFSGDKLLGGPQAGLVAGAAPLVRRLRRDVLARCLRLDKSILAALEATLGLHALGPAAVRRRLPALRALAADPAELHRRAAALAARLAGPGRSCEAVACESRVGSGAAPTVLVPSAGLRLRVERLAPVELAARLRRSEPPVIPRVQDEAVLLDLRTVAPGEEETLVRVCLDALGAT
ncbi:MAG: L-seryl-tRNA(Sec) selenium transferase [Planctomycetota bacterium]|nr:MAG: L-seryl-tRNA(Sec) selenium transferase [Planctomycetota bacterium]